MLFSPVIERALRVASIEHRHQMRKATAVPYISHLAGVALILQRAGFAHDEWIAAAILHDVVEDTSCTVDRLTAEFPSEVVKLVQETTEDKRDVAGTPKPWRVRKEEHLARVRTASRGARAIILADKLHNLGTMVYDIDAGESLQTRFNAPWQDVLWYQREMVSVAGGVDTELQVLVSECRQLIARLEQTSV